MIYRFERPPVVEPAKFWHKVPIRRKNTFRRLALEHIGASNAISEHTIVRAHDRSLPMLIKMFASSNFGKRSFAATDSKTIGEDWDSPGRIMEIQDALKNYWAVWFYLWNFDPSPLVLLTVLIDNNYGSQLGEDEKGRVKFLTEFIDTFFRENARRAVTRDPPLSTREAKERWTEAAGKRAAFYPGAYQYNRDRNDARQKTGRGGNNSRGRGAKSTVPTRGGAAFKGKGAKYQGHNVCYLFNKPAGCTRVPKGVGCDNGAGGEFAHVCNMETGKDTYCLGAHARHTGKH